MASHSGRPGAIRKKGTKKGAQVGTGGHSRRRLEGKGPTPKAEDRPAHKRYAGSGSTGGAGGRGPRRVG